MPIEPLKSSDILLLPSRFSRVQLCATPETTAHQAPPSLGFSRQEHWSGLPFPSAMHEREKWKWSRSVVADSVRPHGLQPTRLLHPWDFPGKSTGVGCHWYVTRNLENHELTAHTGLWTCPREIWESSTFSPKAFGKQEVKVKAELSTVWLSVKDTHSYNHSYTHTLSLSKKKKKQKTKKNLGDWFPTFREISVQLLAGTNLSKQTFQ